MKRTDFAREIVLTALALAALLGISAARAQDAPVGKVRGIYVEAGRGVLLEQKLARGVQAKAVWVDVDFGAQSGQAQRRVLAQLPADMKVEQGDLVEVSLAERGQASAAAPIQNVTRANQVAAKWYSEQAESFDRPKAASGGAGGVGPISLAGR
jgi:hypothetical protein